MLTVTVGRDGSGKSSTRAPLARRYSVTPSTVATFLRGVRRADAGRDAAEDEEQGKRSTHGGLLGPINRDVRRRVRGARRGASGPRIMMERIS